MGSTRLKGARAMSFWPPAIALMLAD